MLVLMLMATLAGDPAAPPASPAPGQRPSIITNPDWVVKPRGEDFTAFYPKAAASKGLAGRATISCNVNPEGALVDCVAVNETPVGEGFGAAAVAMGTRFKMRPATLNGVAVAGGTVRIPILFTAPERQIDALTVNLSCYGKSAAFLESDTTSEPVRTAMVFFAGQILLLDAQAKAKPSIYEDDLRQARMWAQAHPKADTQPTLKRCIDFAGEMRAKAAAKMTNH